MVPTMPPPTRSRSSPPRWGRRFAPWGLSFMQSYAVDKKLRVEDLKLERIDVITGAVLTGVIGFFVVVVCAATPHRDAAITDAADAAVALQTAGRVGGVPASPSDSSARRSWPPRSCQAVDRVLGV